MSAKDYVPDVKSVMTDISERFGEKASGLFRLDKDQVDRLVVIGLIASRNLAELEEGEYYAISSNRRMNELGFELEMFVEKRK